MKNLKKEVENLFENPDKTNFSCPNYSKFWISDITCATSGLSNLSKCEINSNYTDEHDCDNTDCIWIGCDGIHKNYNKFILLNNI